jgi:hypothetical protein
MKRQGCWRAGRPLSLLLLPLLESFGIALAWAVEIRLHICCVYAITGVEDGKRERAYNTQARRMSTVAVAVAAATPRSPRTCGHAAEFYARFVAPEEEHEIWRQYGERALVRPVWGAMYLTSVGDENLGAFDGVAVYMCEA